MIGVVVTLKVADGKHEDFQQAAKDLMAKTKANEPGTLFYQLFQSKTDPATYYFLEHYASEEALKSHGESQHYLAAAPKLGACLAGAPDLQYLNMIE